MKDLRVNKLAERIIQQSIVLKPGEKILIEGWDCCDDMVAALVEQVYRAGGLPFLSRERMSTTRAVMLGCTEQSMTATQELEMQRMQQMDAFVSVRRYENSSEYADVPPERLDCYNRHIGAVRSFRTRTTRWCVIRYPTQSMAQASKMSNEAFENYFFSVCDVDYAQMNRQMIPLIAWMQRTDRVRILAQGTDLTFSIRGQTTSDQVAGRYNLPDGEVSTGPVKESVNGTIQYNIPSNYLGTVFSAIRFTFRDGRIVEAAGSHPEQINMILDSDENARYIGEFSIGIHPLITEPIIDTLFDEKMTGSLHFTPGYFPSKVHWDIVQSHLPAYGGGELWFDDVLIRKDGIFLPPALQGLNPDQLLKGGKV